MALARSVMQNEVLDVALRLPKQQLHLEIETRNVMSVLIPVFKPEFKTADSGDVYSYGYAFTPFDLDSAIKALSDILPKLLRLAEVEKSCQLMAAEIEKTRRRVNALERLNPSVSGNDKVYHHETGGKRTRQHNKADEGQGHDAGQAHQYGR